MIFTVSSEKRRMKWTSLWSQYITAIFPGISM